MKMTAKFSECRQYRYDLTRQWVEDSDDLKSIAFVCLNPSTADEFQDDPTVRRCINFSKRWGFGRFIMLNIFGFRSTDPKGLRTVADPVGPGNDAALQETFAKVDRVIVAWGNHGRMNFRGDQVLKMIDDPYCLDVTGLGCPKHPLYIRGDTVPFPFPG